jgi:hypothetical protein
MCKIRRALVEIGKEPCKDQGDWAQFNHEVYLLVATSVAINGTASKKSEGENDLC